MIYMENPHKKRYYLLYTEQDLFGNWCVVKSFGSLISRRGRSIIQVCNNKAHALDEIFLTESKKRQRGYIYADLPHVDHFYLRPQTIKEVIAAKLAAAEPYKPMTIVTTKPSQNPNQLDLF